MDQAYYDSPGPPIPPEFAQHPLIANQVFLSLPKKLLALVDHHVDPSPIEPIRALEEAAAATCGDHSKYVGFWNGTSLEYDGLEDIVPMPHLTEEQVKSLGWESPLAKVEFVLKKGNQWLAPMRTFARGYAGWLLTNPVYMAEQAQLIAKWTTQIRAYGLRGVGRITLVSDAQAIPGVQQSADESLDAFDDNVRTFLIRWRLKELCAPNLPVPMTPMMAGLFSVSILPQLMDAGGLFNIPDTSPIPSRDELRGILENAIRGRSGTEYLEEWHRIVRGSNPAKNRVDRFARIRRLVHYWRVLHGRHASRLKGKTTALEYCFADFFEVHAGSIKADLREVRKRLGPNWLADESLLSL